MMTTLREAAHQALEALEKCTKHLPVHFDSHFEAITSLRAALAEPVQEPVATITECEACFTPDVCQLRGTCDHYAAERLRVAAPPQREPLTEEEIRDLWSWAMTAEAERTATTQQHAFARAIERAHGITEPGIKEDK